jgi:hypothetical protein
MIGAVVDGVNTDSVEAQLLELGDITSASSRVGERVNKIGRSTRLVIDASDVESGGPSEECYQSVSN